MPAATILKHRVCKWLAFLPIFEGARHILPSWPGCPRAALRRALIALKVICVGRT